jgi:hypothetical protein
MRRPTDGANISDRPIEIGIAASANKYAGSLARIGSGDRLADSTATAGDERDFPGQLLLSLTCHFANAIT